MAGAARTNMFLSRMMQQEGAGAAAPKGGVQSAPVTPPSADSGGSARSLPTAAGAGGDGGRSGGDNGLSASQPLAGAAAGVEAEAPRPLPGTPPPAAGAAWEEPIAGGRDAPGMRYEIYDLSTAQLRQEMAVCQQRLQGGARAEWQAWGGWISEELEERLAGEDILSAIATIQGEGDPFDDDNDAGQVGGGGGGAVVLDQRSDSVLSTSVSQPASASPKTLRVKMRRGAPQGHSEAEYRRAAAAELNRTAGGARRNRAKKQAPAWASGKTDPPADEEPPAADEPLSPQRQQPQPQPQPEAQPEPRKQQAPGPKKKKKKRADKPERAALQAPKASAGPAAGAAAQAAAPAPAPAAASPLRASGAGQAAEPAIRRSTEEMSEALEVRSASLDQRMEEERQQLWLQQQAAQAEVERIAREEEQQRQEQEQRRLAEQAERQEAERLARQLEEKKKREEAQLRDRLEAERRQKEKQQQQHQAAERRKKAEEEEAQRQAAEVKRRAAEAEERRAAEAAEIEQLEAESKRRMEEARQIKLAMMVRTIDHSSSQAAGI